MAARAGEATNPGTNELGFKTMRKGIKEAADENLLTPRFYTTDFEEMERMFSEELHPNLDMDEFVATLKEFQASTPQLLTNALKYFGQALQVQLCLCLSIFY